jgi:hypothetical protein
VEEHIEPSVRVQTEFEEWCQAGCEKAEQMMNKSDKEEK